jgi:leucyl-tRNA synthetase
MAQELGDQIGRSGELFHHPWPIPDPRALTREELLIVVQVDGRVRSRLSVEIGAGEEAVKAKALADARIQSWLQSRTVERVVVVPGRLVNIVTRGE